MPTDYDAGKIALDALLSWADNHAIGADRNEATTRLHLIDGLLKDVLRWNKASIRCEEPAGSGRIDYACGAPATLFILEAKREGVYFELPAGTRTGIHTIESLVSGTAGRALCDAMQQFAGYAARNGVGPAAVCNGRQLVLFLASRTDGIAPLQGRALVFAGLDDMRNDFRLLWDNASKFGIEERRIYQTLQSVPASAPRPLSATLSQYPGTKRRNDPQSGLDILGELFLEDVTRLEELRKDFHGIAMRVVALYRNTRRLVSKFSRPDIRCFEVKAM